jgi:hypothetical protein
MPPPPDTYPVKVVDEHVDEAEVVDEHVDVDEAEVVAEGEGEVVDGDGDEVKSEVKDGDVD